MNDSRYTWNEVAGRYIGPNGRFVSFATTRSHMDATLDNYERRVISLGESLRARRITIPEWQVGMRDAVKDIHLMSGSLARGGWAQMSPADYGRVGNTLRFQHGRLAKFAKEIEGGLALDGRFMRRHMLYAQAGRVSYTAALRQEMAMRGMTEEISILARADHCTECLSEAAKGWVPIGELVNIGERICRSNCRCHLLFR